MIHMGLFHHATFEHMLEDDKTLLYCFAPNLNGTNIPNGVPASPPRTPLQPLNGPSAHEASPAGVAHDRGGSPATATPSDKEVPKSAPSKKSNFFKERYNRRMNKEKAAKAPAPDLYGASVVQAMQLSLAETQRSVEFTLQATAATNSAVYAHTKMLHAHLLDLSAAVQRTCDMQVYFFLLSWMAMATCAMCVAQGALAGLLTLTALSSIALFLHRSDMLPVLLGPRSSLPAAGLDFPHPRGPTYPPGSTTLAGEAVSNRDSSSEDSGSTGNWESAVVPHPLRRRSHSTSTINEGSPRADLMSLSKKMDMAQREVYGEGMLDSRLWPQRSVMLRLSPQAPDQRRILPPPSAGQPTASTAPPSGEDFSKDPFNGRMLKYNEVFAFETDLFKGTAVVHMNKLKYTLQYMIQGRFKRDNVRIDKAKTGHIFYKPLNLPSSFLVSSASAIARGLINSLTLTLDGPAPFAVSPFCHVIDTLNVAVPGTEEPLADIVDKPREDCRLLHPLCANAVATRAGRVKALLKLPPEACFSPDYVHTFELSIASGVKMDTWELDVPILPKVDIAKCMNHQPLYVMAFMDGSSSYKNRKDKTPPEVQSYLFNFELWHERLVLDCGKTMKKRITERFPQRQKRTSKSSWSSTV